MWNQFFPEQASTLAPDVDGIFLAVLGLALLFAIPVACLVVIFAIRYRRGAMRERYVSTHEGRGKSRTWILETAWIVIPLCLALSIFAWAASLYLRIYAMPTNGMDVYVVAKQWMWKFQLPTGQTEINELHVPIGYPVRLTMISEDVIHSFFVSAFRVKRDVLPGVYTTMWFEATKTGTFMLECAEFCGTDHSRMLGSVIVMDQAAYQNWLSQRGIGGGTGAVAESSAGEAAAGAPARPVSMADAGAQLFQQHGCASCHHADGSGVGPSLVGIWGTQVKLEGGQTATVDMDYIRRSVYDPQAQIVAGYQPVMPTFKGQIDEQQLLSLTEYIRSLAGQESK
jgi:cytochrome c oxidase subunit 2